MIPENSNEGTDGGLPAGTCSARVEYEFQYRDHGGTWQSGSFEQDETRAKSHFAAMTARFPSQEYRLIRRTVVDEIISQNV